MFSVVVESAEQDKDCTRLDIHEAMIDRSLPSELFFQTENSSKQSQLISQNKTQVIRKCAQLWSVYSSVFSCSSIS
jgi:hypothetical protein